MNGRMVTLGCSGCDYTRKTITLRTDEDAALDNDDE